jgi:hypothetical protein
VLTLAIPSNRGVLLATPSPFAVTTPTPFVFASPTP